MTDRAERQPVVTLPLSLLKELLLGPERKPLAKEEMRERKVDKDGWPARWSDPTYLGDGPWGA